MNGVHDMGGMMDFGPVVAEVDEPTFHANWERRAFGVTLAASATGAWNVDMGRSARESLPPAVYLSSSYFEIWTRGLEALALATGLISADDLAAGHAVTPAKTVARVMKPEQVPASLQAGTPSERPPQAGAHFAVGDQVRTRNINPHRHTRLPRYARGRRGVVESVHGAHVFPDAHAHDLGEAPQWLYTVRFTGQELWGDDADPTLTTSIEAWESYLEPR